jgi:hypothetical protein
MSYIANLVHRTLGVTPVAQPVIQAKFSPRSQPVSASGQDSGAVRTAAPALSTSQASLLAARSQTNNARPEAAWLHEGKGTPAGRLQHPARLSNANSANPNSANPDLATADPVANESQSVLAPERRREDLRLQPPNPPARSVTVQARAQEPSNWSQPPDDAVEEFRLMKPTPPAPGLRSSSSVAGSAPSPSLAQSRKSQSAERPVVRVHIGRVDVRMVTPVTKEPRAAVQAVQEAKPASLDEYLRARQRGTR